MALRAGMRVKKVRGLYAIGAIGVVASFSVPEENRMWYGDDVVITPDLTVQDSGGVWLAGQAYTGRTEEWEPIQPERNTVITWAECKEWQPEHIREGVSA